MSVVFEHACWDLTFIRTSIIDLCVHIGKSVLYLLECISFAGDGSLEMIGIDL